jgi:rhodanese-related sulfurtransferase
MNITNYFKNIERDKWGYILPTQLRQMIEVDVNPFFMVDLRDASSYRQGHIDGAVNFYWLDILNYLDRLPKGQKILLICYLGFTASQVMVILRLLGYNAFTLKFGMGIPPDKSVPVAGWIKLGYPVISTSHIDQIQDEFADYKRSQLPQ